MGKILVCESEETIRETLKQILSDYYDMILTDDAGQCLDFIDHAKDIELVLFGLDEKNKETLETIGKIKEKRSDLRTIVLVGYKSGALGEEAVRHGASGYLVKPFKSEELLSTVRSVLR